RFVTSAHLSGRCQANANLRYCGCGCSSGRIWQGRFCRSVQRSTNTSRRGSTGGSQGQIFSNQTFWTTSQGIGSNQLQVCAKSIACLYDGACDPLSCAILSFLFQPDVFLQKGFVL